MIEIVNENYRKIMLGEFEHQVFVLGYVFHFIESCYNLLQLIRKPCSWHNNL